MKPLPRRLLGSLAALLFSACLAGGCAGSVAEECALVGEDRAFGQCCAVDTDCASGLCHTFGESGPTCTETCTSADTCPAGSQGQKCNRKGVCRP